MDEHNIKAFINHFHTSKSSFLNRRVLKPFIDEGLRTVVTFG